jgi:hypothetical protein
VGTGLAFEVEHPELLQYLEGERSLGGDHTCREETGGEQLNIHRGGVAVVARSEFSWKFMEAVNISDSELLNLAPRMTEGPI